MPIAGSAILIMLASLFTANVQSGITDVSNNREARLLHKAHCTACHTPMIYNRKKRRVNSYQELVKQVKGCNHMLSKNFSQQQLSALVQYLNTNYYKFK